jgi:tRNA (guanine37-N1)-methyltransferase
MKRIMKRGAMQFDVVSLFPEMFAALTQSGVTRRAFEQQRWGLSLWNPRDFTTDNHRTVDDRPYGGGPGMVMLAKPLEAAIGAAKQRQVHCSTGRAAGGVHVAARPAADPRG